MEKKNFLTQVDEERIAEDPDYARDRRRQKMVHELIGLRHKLKLTQQQVADKMGVKRSQVGNIEGDPVSVSLDLIARYAEALGAEVVVKLPKKRGTVKAA